MDVISPLRRAFRFPGYNQIGMEVEMIIPPCIFCFQRTDFSREHVISKAVGGSLVLDDAVCKECNSKLGSLVDAELVRLPEVIDAFEALGISFDRDKVLNRHYRVVDLSRGIKDLNPDGTLSHPQILADGSMVLPESQTWAVLRKTIDREGDTIEEEIDPEIVRLQAAYYASEINEPIHSKLFGRTIVKKRERFEIEVRPRRTPRPCRAMAKIAYEFLFLIAGGRQLYSPENMECVNALLDMIEGKTSDRSIRCLRLAPLTEHFEDSHGIRFERGQQDCTFRIVLFGKIHYFLVIPQVSEGVLNAVKNVTRQDVSGLEYIQRVTKSGKVFRALTPAGKPIWLPVG